MIIFLKSFLFSDSSLFRKLYEVLLAWLTPAPLRGLGEITEEAGGCGLCSSHPSFSQAPCNLNLRSVSSLDIVIPGLNSSTDVQARINAGESIHIIRGMKGESLTQGPSQSSGRECWAGQQNKCI